MAANKPNREQVQALYTAALDGNLKQVKELLSAGMRSG
jgi:hypothetical protein